MKIFYNQKTKKYNEKHTKDEIINMINKSSKKLITCHYSDGSILHETENIKFACTLITGYRGAYIQI